MAGELTFEQVKKARVFAWHSRHYVFASDTLLRVIVRDHTDRDPDFRDLAAMIIRPSSLRGTEHLLDDGWHHLADCSCAYCAPHDAETKRADRTRESCGGPAA